MEYLKIGEKYDLKYSPEVQKKISESEKIKKGLLNSCFTDLKIKKWTDSIFVTLCPECREKFMHSFNDISITQTGFITGDIDLCEICNKAMQEKIKAMKNE